MEITRVAQSYLHGFKPGWINCRNDFLLPFGSSLILQQQLGLVYMNGQPPGLTSPKQRIAYIVGWLLLVAVSMTQQAMWPQFVVLVCLMWLCGFVSILLHPRFSAFYQNRWVAGLLGWVLMLCAWISLMALFQIEHGRLWLLWMFVLTTATDVGAFLSDAPMDNNR